MDTRLPPKQKIVGSIPTGIAFLVPLALFLLWPILFLCFYLCMCVEEVSLLYYGFFVSFFL